MSLIKSVKGVLSEFASVEKLNFENTEKPDDWLLITWPNFDRLTS